MEASNEKATRVAGGTSSRTLFFHSGKTARFSMFIREYAVRNRGVTRKFICAARAPASFPSARNHRRVSDARLFLSSIPLSPLRLIRTACLDEIYDSESDPDPVIEDAIVCFIALRSRSGHTNLLSYFCATRRQCDGACSRLFAVFD